MLAFVSAPPQDKWMLKAEFRQCWMGVVKWLRLLNWETWMDGIVRFVIGQGWFPTRPWATNPAPPPPLPRFLSVFTPLLQLICWIQKKKKNSCGKICQPTAAPPQADMSLNVKTAWKEVRPEKFKALTCKLVLYLCPLGPANQVLFSVDKEAVKC